MTDETQTETTATPSFPSDEAFARVKADLAEGNELTLAHIGEIFGADFWVLIVYALMDAQDAARAIQGAISRLSNEKTAKAKKVTKES